MKFYNCDRCKKVLSDNERNKVKTIEWDNTIDKIDLCDKCFKDLNRFIYSGGVTNE